MRERQADEPHGPTEHGGGQRKGPDMSSETSSYEGFGLLDVNRGPEGCGDEADEIFQRIVDGRGGPQCRIAYPRPRHSPRAAPMTVTVRLMANLSLIHI